MGQRKVRIGVAALAALSAESWILPAGAADYSISGGNTYTDTETLAGTDRLSIEPGGKLSVNKKAAINWNDASSDLQISNAGTIESTKAGGRAIDATGSDNTRTLTLENKTSARIKSDSDAFRINVNPTGGTVTVNNAGTIQSSTKRALDFEAAASGAATVTIDNAATGMITSGGDDAIRPGQGATVNNSGTIRTNGQAADKADGIDFKAATAGTVNNNDSGTISGARHGVTLSGSNGAGSVTVNNAANATITGRNGSGVGSDAGGTVTNYGTIEGAYSGNGTQDGDGDGVDIDFAGTIGNHGTIKGTGAGGYDKNGRANNSEGISLGGGTITNSGTISGAAYGIVVNNDSNPDNSRSGAAATTITNDVGGTIEGKGGYAIRLENKTGTAADADTIVNKGTIIGNGTIPDPSGVVLLKDGRVDGGSVGTLDGVRYTGTGAARFIRGDGAAIQMGEGDDVLTNYGTITGNSGRAISLEGGNDILNLFTGSTITGSTITGRIDGGTGTDTLNLDKAATGPGTGTLANVVNFEVLNVKGGAWALTDDHTYARGATVAAGATLTIGNGATAGSLTADIANTGALVFDRSDAASYAGTIFGSGSLTKVNTGTLTLSGIHTYTGATTISGGTLALSGAGAVTVSSGVALATGAALDISGLTGAGTAITALTDTAPGQAGTVALGAKTLAITNANGSFGGTISGSGGLTLAGGTQTLTGANTYTGATTILGGTLRAGAAGSFAPASAVTVAGGANLDLANFSQTIGSLAGAGTVALGSGTLHAGGDNASTAFSGAIVGTGDLFKEGTGLLTLAGVNTYTGLTFVYGGTLALVGSGSIAASSQMAIAAGATLDISGIAGTGTSIATLTQQSTLGDGRVELGDKTLTLSRARGAFDGVIQGTGGLILGGGTQTFLTANTYTGATTIAGGTLALAATGSIAASRGVALATGGTFDISGVSGAGTAIAGLSDTAPGQAGAVTLGARILTLSNASGRFGGTIAGAGGLTLGGGTQRLIGANTYTGTTTVSAGTLVIENGAALGAADGTAATGTTVASGATLALQGGIAVGDEPLSLAGSGIGRGGALRSVSGDNIYAGAITLNRTSTITVAADTLTLSGTIAGAAGANPSLCLSGPGSGFLTGNITGGLAALIVSGGGTWTLTGRNTPGGGLSVEGATRLRLEGGGTLTTAGGGIDFGAAATVSGAGSRLTPQNTFTVGQFGAGALTVAQGGGVSFGARGTGTVTLARSNGSSGTLTIGARAGQAAVAAGTVQASEVHFGAGTGALVFNHTGNPDGTAVTFATTITGRGRVDHLAGITILIGANTYTGTTTLSGGTLSVANAHALGSSATTVSAGATLDVNGVTLGNALTLAGSGAGWVGALTGTSTAGVSGAITLAGNIALGGTGNLTVSGSIGDGGNRSSLTKIGTGTAIFTAANTYGGGTTVAAGTLALGGAGTLGSALATTTITGATSVLDLGGTRQTQAAVSLGQGATLQNGALTAPVTAAGGTVARISGPATLTTTDGTTVSTANTYTGATTIGDGSVLKAGGVGGFAAASPHTLAGTGTLDLAGAANTVGALVSASPATVVTSSAGGPAVLTVAGLSAGSFAGTIRDGVGPLGLTLAGDTLTLTGANTYTGVTTIGRGATLRLGDGGTAGAIVATAGVVNDGALVFDRTDAVSFAPAISGSGSLTQAGGGTTVLTGRNTNTGATTIRGGTLQIDGVLAASEVTVKSGGTLAGSGKIGDPLIEAGGRLAPGSATAIGTLSITGPLTFAPGSFYTVKVTPTANDRTAVTGPVTIQGGTVQVLAGAGTYTPALRYTLLTASGGVTGQFSSLQTTSNLAFLTPSLAYDGHSVSLGFAQTAPLTSVATTLNQGNLAQALNGAGPTVTTTATTGSDALDTHRTVLFPGFSQAITGRAGGTTLQSFSEVGYRMGGAARSVEPFVGVAMLRLHQDGLTETGGSAALAVFGRSYGVETVTAGAQAQAIVADLFGGAGPLVARGLIGYRRAFGTVAPAALLAFRGGGTAFRTGGGPLAEDAAVVSAGLDWEIAPGARLGLAYDGQIGRRAQDHAVKGSLSYRW
ncbi:autotransporter-associated beta strand repeat-containing protein [Methylobacterium sp. 391_Methyba4]|uniref:autotransporter-associated beta strand repeat-containing protein n=1 Tax=Methylobacterium sp. 391_Methyba4 TaxID=3038924 RepID=UPI00241EF74A|nr:autotransporter-associated beta strand repeat-containing protein [Methylobacterium sp. 391_Methyba4]WFS06849.1 autotransporter-associated beta strand repeat-containing protein [Methylobacterium sp. 391_Methyba4]